MWPYTENLSIMDMLRPLKLSPFLIMEVKQYTKVLVWDQNKCPEYRGFLYIEVGLPLYNGHVKTSEIVPFPYYEGQTIHLIWDRNKCPNIEVSYNYMEVYSVGPLYNGHIGTSLLLIMKLKQHTKVLVWD